MLQEIPDQIKIRGHVVKITPTGKYSVYSWCKTCEALNLELYVDPIEKEKIDLIYENNYDEKLGKRISNEANEEYQKALFSVYTELFAKLREIAKSLK